MVEETVPSTGLPNPKSNSATGNLRPDEITRAGPSQPRTNLGSINPVSVAFINACCHNLPNIGRESLDFRSLVTVGRCKSLQVIDARGVNKVKALEQDAGFRREARWKASPEIKIRYARERHVTS